MSKDLIALEQIRDGVVRPTLKDMDCWSHSAERLVLGTGLVESKFKYRYQWTGPALGFYQCEPTTLKYVIEYMKRKPKFFRTISQFAFPPFDAEQLVWNEKFATAICRLHYCRFPEALPEYDDHQGLGKYWKKYYNSKLGKGTVQKFVESTEIMKELSL